MSIRNAAIFIGTVLLSLMSTAEMLQCEIDNNGIVWMYESGIESVIKGVENVAGACNPCKLRFPTVLGGRNVVAISDGAFKSCGYLKEIFVPAGIQRIGNEAFANCSNLSCVKMEGG